VSPPTTHKLEIYFIEIPTLCDKGFEQRSAKWVGAFRRRRHFEFRRWFDDGAADLKEAAMARARDLEYSFTGKETPNLDLGIERALSQFKEGANAAQPNHVLLLLDDVDRPKLLESEQVRRLARAEWLHIIVTTRLDGCELFGRQGDRTFLTLNKLPEEEALTLIRRRQSGGEFPDEVTRDTRRRKNMMDTSTTFLFEVVFKDIPVLGEPQNYPVNDRSVILEVEPESILKTTTYLPLGEAAREWAKELAPQFAMQAVQKDLPHGFEPRYSVREIDQLPPDLDHRPAEFNGNQFRAWLL
jgi:hypothetical protein